MKEEKLGGTFGQCLKYLLEVHGTRPDGSPEKPGKAWGHKEFAYAVGVTDRAVRYWLRDQRPVTDFLKIEAVLFGNSKRFDEWRLLLTLQLHFFCGSESIGHHDSEVMDGRGIDRGDA